MQVFQVSPFVSVAVALLASCASTQPARPQVQRDRDVTPDLYVGEFLADRKTDLAPHGWAPEEEVLPDPELITELRRRNRDVLAVAMFHSGHHPKWTVVFLANGTDSVRVIATHTYWGAIQVKRVGQLPLEAFESMQRDMTARLECKPQLERGYFFWGFSYWRDDAVQFCSGPIFGEDAQFFGTTLTPAMKATKVVYSVWDKK